MRSFGMKWGLPLLVGLVLIGGGLLAVVVAKRESNLLCEAVNDNRAALRNLLVSARNQTPKARLTRRARRFYREQIAAVTPLDCGNFDRDSLRRIAERGDADAKKTQPP